MDDAISQLEIRGVYTMINLFQFHPCWNVPSASPFCIKLETYLKMANLKYQNQYLDDPRKAPKGKLPYITDNDITIADSGLIIDYLNENWKKGEFAI